MKRSLMVVLVTVATLALSPAAFGDIVIGSTGTWQSWAPGDLNENGNPYWDHTSGDGALKNVGYCLAGTGNCGMADAPGNLAYLGQAGGAADPSFYLTRTGSSDLIALKIEIAGNAGSNRFGWYDTTNVAGYNSHEIFDGGKTTGFATVYIPTANYGFWFQGDEGTYFTQSGSNKGGGVQQFAIFQQTAGQVYWLGMEDRHAAGTDYDYNDMIVKVSSVPDGGVTLMLLGGALVGLHSLRRKFRV